MLELQSLLQNLRLGSGIDRIHPISKSSRFARVDDLLHPKISPPPRSDSKPLVNVAEFRAPDLLQGAARANISHRFALTSLRLLRFRLLPRLRLGPVLPRLRSDGDSIDGSRGIASGAVVSVSATSVTVLPLLGLRLLDETLQFLDCLRVHLHHAPFSSSNILDSILSHPL